MRRPKGGALETGVPPLPWSDGVSRCPVSPPVRRHNERFSMNDVAQAKVVALDFVDRINGRDADRLAQAMTDDHAFIDTDGNSVVGRERMRVAWVGYYRLFPDYHVRIDEVLVRGNEVVLIGRSDGTLSEHGQTVLAGPDGTLPPYDEMQGSAIWTAEIRDTLVARWHVFRDTAATRAKLGVVS